MGLFHHIFVHLFLALIAHGEVVTLDESNFDEQTSEGRWYLEFFAPWCGHCKKFAPIYEEASETIENVKFGAIDATVEKNLAQRFDVSRFPTIKFYEDGIVYGYNGMRTIESLSEYATDMLKPIAIPLTEESFMKAKNRFTVSFIYVGNDVTDDIIELIEKQLNDVNSNIDLSSILKQDSNLDIFLSSIKRYRPDINFFLISKHIFAKLMNDKKSQLNYEIYLKHNKEHIDKSESMILGTTPSMSTQMYHSNEFTHESVIEFIEKNKFAPVIEMELREYKELFESTQYFGIGFVDFENKEKEVINDQFITRMETLMISKQNEWQSMPRVNEENELRKEEMKENDPHSTHYDLDSKTKEERRKMMFAVANYTKYTDWANGMFAIEQDKLPQLIVLDTMSDGYYKDKTESVSEEFINKVFNDELEVTYIRNWFSRQGIKLERWLNSRSGWQLFGLMVGVFVTLLSLMVLLDYCCAPERQKLE